MSIREPAQQQENLSETSAPVCPREERVLSLLEKKKNPLFKKKKIKIKFCKSKHKEWK